MFITLISRSNIVLVTFLACAPISAIAATQQGGFINRVAVGALGGVLIAIGAVVWHYLKKGIDKIENHPEWVKTGQEGFTELMGHAAKGDVVEIQRLISEGCDVNAQDSQGITALIYAAQASKFEAIETLLNSGADKGIKTKTGHTAYQFANAYEGAAYAKAAKLLK